MDSVKRVREFEALNPKLVVFITLLLQCSGIHAEHDAERMGELQGNHVSGTYCCRFAYELTETGTKTRPSQGQIRHGEREVVTESHFKKKLLTGARRAKISLLQWRNNGVSRDSLMLSSS